MRAITFSLKTIQPLLATSFEGDPNSDVAYPYIPGSIIRGALIGRYLKSNNLQNIDVLENETVQRLFFNGKTRYLNAYLSSQEEKRTLPTLLSWCKEKGEEFQEKDSSITIYDFGISKANLESPKPIDESFWIEERGYVRLYSVSRRINIHNLRDRSKGRSTDTEGEIFRYDAIDAGQTFQAVILCEDDDESIIKNLLTSSDIWLGGSRSAGYGHTEIFNVSSNNSWNEIDSTPEERINSNTLKITLLSDLIFRDQWGQYVAQPPTELLADLLDKPVEEVEELEKALNKSKTFMTSTYIGSFNRKWGLPLPQVIAIKAGSVFVYENVSVNLQHIQKLETEGLGERRIEGFGRIAINWRMDEDNFSAKKPDKKSEQDKYLPSKQPQLQTQESCKLAQKIAERILHQNLESYLLGEVERYKFKSNDSITNNQLSRLMIVSRQALDQGSREPIDKLLSNLTSNARTQYERTYINNQSLNEQIKEWLYNPKSWIHNLSTVTIANQQADLTDQLALEYTFRLIMAIAKNAIKEKGNE